VERRPENRIHFSSSFLEPTGQPRPIFEYSLSAAERSRHEAALAGPRGTGQLLGTFLPFSPPQKLSPGSSMHLMGTAWMSEAGDGHSVADTYGRV
jgi:pyranose oxidase